MNKSPTWRSAFYLLLLITALVALLWLIEGWGDGRPPLPSPESNESTGPVLSPPGGAYDRSLLLHMEPSHPQAQILFATGGHVPTTTVGTRYQHPLQLDASFPNVTVVRAREVVNGTAGPLVNASYITGLDTTLPILSHIADPIDLWDSESGLLSHTWQRGQEWERPVHITYVEGDHSWQFESPAGLRIHGSRRSTFPKSSFRLYFRNEYGAARLEAPLFPGHPSQEVQSYKRLLLQSGNLSGRWTLLENQLVIDTAAEINRHGAQGRFVLLFLNGESWGIYRLSERADRFFLADNLGIPSADLIRDGDIEGGDDQHWEALVDWLETHDLSQEANYATIQSQIDVADFIDYTILQSYFGFSADRFDAARPRVAGGRWFWLYGDDEQGIGQGPSLVESFADQPDLSLLLLKLLENPEFRAQFIERSADLMNTILSPPAMATRIDRLATQLRNDISYEEARWPTPTDWESNLTALHRFAQQQPDLLRQQITHALELEGTARLIVQATSKNGRLYVNGTALPSDLGSNPSWSGDYFLGSQVQVIAVPCPGYGFSGWEELSAESGAEVTVTIDKPRTLTARFTPLSPDDPSLRPDDVMITEYWINDNGTRYATIDNRPIEGDWLELRVVRPSTVDLRGWRITDNDTKTGTGEGSIILPQLEALAAVPRDTVILIVATENQGNTVTFSQDDLDPTDGQMVFYVGNGNLDTTTDPGFGISTRDDNLVLLAPGPNPAFADDIGIDFVAEGDAVTPLSFGVLSDGVTFDLPFGRLGADDGVWFTRPSHNDNANEWIVDPPYNQTGDGTRPYDTNNLTPGALNDSPGRIGEFDLMWPILLGLVLVIGGVLLRAWRNPSNLENSSLD